MPCGYAASTATKGAPHEPAGTAPVAAHTIDNHHRIGLFLAGTEHHEPGQHGEGYKAASVEPHVLLASSNSATSSSTRYRPRAR